MRQTVRQDDPRGLKPVIRLTAAIATSFAGSCFIGMALVAAIVEEPEGWRLLRLASGAAFAITSIWSVILYRQWARERRKG